MAVDVDRTTLTEEVAAIFRGERLEDPWPIWDQLREDAPVLEVGPMFVVSRFDESRALVSDREQYSQKLWITGSRADAIVASFTPEGAEIWRKMAAIDSNMMTRADNDEHDRLRAVAHRYFTPRRIRDLEAVLQQFVDDLLADAAKTEGPYDFKTFSQDLPLRAMCHIIGSPQVDRQYVLESTSRIGRYLGTDREDIVRDAYDARLAFNQYIEEAILDEHRRNPGTNEFVTTLMDSESEENLTPIEVIMMISIILFAGIETTSVLLSNGLVELMKDDRRQWELLCEDPSRAGAAVDELLRWVSPAQWVPRTTQQTVEIDGVEIPPGQTVMAAVAAANRDPREFEDADRLEILRGGRPHLAMGYGAKFCLGSSLLRAEARIGLQTLAERHPNLELAVDPAELDWSKSNPLLRTMSELPVNLGS
jgi:cytochrome P450